MAKFTKFFFIENFSIIDIEHYIVISIILSFRNEEAILEKCIKILSQEISKINTKFELIFIDDNSIDNSFETLSKIAEKNNNVKIIKMSRRFGTIPCQLAGLKYAKGDYAVIMDCDLQDPPELISKMYQLIKSENLDIIHTKRLTRTGESKFKLFLTKIAYRLINLFSEIKLENDVGIFKIFSRKIIDDINHINEYDPYLRGLFYWVGYKQKTIEYHRAQRIGGESQYGLLESIYPYKEFVRGITSFSMTPLYLALYFGIIISLISVIFILVSIINKFFNEAVTTGWTSLFASIWFFGGLIIFLLGIIGIYIAKIFENSRGRPRYLVDKKINI